MSRQHRNKYRENRSCTGRVVNIFWIFLTKNCPQYYRIGPHTAALGNIHFLLEVMVSKQMYVGFYSGFTEWQKAVEIIFFRMFLGIYSCLTSLCFCGRDAIIFSDLVTKAERKDRRIQRTCRRVYAYIESGRILPTLWWVEKEEWDKLKVFHH